MIKNNGNSNIGFGIGQFCFVLGPQCYFIVGEGYMILLVCGILVKDLNSRSQTPYRWASKTFINPALDSNPESSDILLPHFDYFHSRILDIYSIF